VLFFVFVCGFWFHRSFLIVLLGCFGLLSFVVFYAGVLGF